MELDINSNRPGAAGYLSNLTKKPFLMDGHFFASIEGFLQGLKAQDIEEQAQIFEMHGPFAKQVGRLYSVKNDTLYYIGKPFNRHSEFYQNLLRTAYTTCFSQNEKMQEYLYQTRHMTLTHKIGKSDPFDTILTEKEFITQLDNLRKDHALSLELLYGEHSED